MQRQTLMAERKSFGNLTQAVSSAQELLTEANVCGHGDPSSASALGYHSPQRSAQTYKDVDTGTVWEWWAGTWTHQ